MNKKKIVVIFVEDEIMYLSSYSYIDDYRPKWGHKLDPNKTKICLTNDINEACEWQHDYQIDTVYETIGSILLQEPDIKSVFRVNSNVFKRYLKIKSLKEKCQEKTNT
jgi:hypothetical protein